MPKKRMFEFGHLFKSDAYKSDALASGVEQNLDGLQKLYDRSMAKIVQIRRNAGLTAKGKQEEFGKLKADLAKELQEWAERKKGYAEQIKQIEVAAHPTRHPRDDVAHEIRASEIRGLLRQLDPTDLEAQVRQAAESGDNELLQAVQYSPIPFKLATAGLLDKISQQRWEREYPADAARLADLQQAQGEVLSALASVRAGLAKQGIETRGQDLSVADAA